MKNLGGQPHRALHLQLLVLCSTDKVSAHCRTTKLLQACQLGEAGVTAPLESVAYAVEIKHIVLSKPAYLSPGS